MFMVVQPFGKNARCSGCQSVTETKGVSSQNAWIELCLAKLTSVANQPALKLRSRNLQMELQTENIGANSERLVCANQSACEVHAAFRNVKLITMPMQYRDTLKSGQGRSAASFAQLDR